MSSNFSNIFSIEEISFFNQLPEVIKAKEKLNENLNMVYFNISVSETIKNTLQNRFGLDLTGKFNIPMRWIKGDTTPHIDTGSSKFKNTYLVYLNDSQGEFILDDETYPIKENTGFIFNEGMMHYAQNTGTTPRLLIGPMNELAEPVGATSSIFYFNNYADAFSMNSGIAIAIQVLSPSFPYTLILGNTQYFNYGSIGNYTTWRVASVSSGDIPSGVYSNGFDLFTLANVSYYVYPSAPCFLEGTKVLCFVDNKPTYLPIETIKPGTLVKTSRDGYKKVELIKSGLIQNPGNDERIENRLYKCSPKNYPELTEDLYITGCHSILVDTLTDKQREETIKYLKSIFVTDKKYRLMACIDEKAEPWNSPESYKIWHLALEHPDIKMNYGIYVNGGLLVETSSINFLKNKSNMS